MTDTPEFPTRRPRRPPGRMPDDMFARRDAVSAVGFPWHVVDGVPNADRYHLPMTIPPAEWSPQECYECEDDGWFDDLDNDGGSVRCSSCGGTGQHTFGVEVRMDDWVGPYTVTKRVHVVQTLPIVTTSDYVPNVPCVEITDQGLLILHYSTDGVMHSSLAITLPPDAAPGMYAIELMVTP